MKKFLSVLLSLIMLFSAFSLVAAAAVEAKKADIPVIYLKGRNNRTIFKTDGTPCFKCQGA